MAISLMNKTCVFTQWRIFLHHANIYNYYDYHNIFLENSRIISFWIGMYNSHLRLVYLYFRKKEGPRISPKRRLPLEWPVKIKRTDFLKNRSFVITVYLYTFGESFVVWTPCRTIVFLHLNLLQSESPPEAVIDSLICGS